jgi:hypothetical protein
MDSVDRTAGADLPGLDLHATDSDHDNARPRSPLVAASGAGVGVIVLLLVTLIRVLDHPRPSVPQAPVASARDEIPPALAPLAQQRQQLQEEVVRLQKAIEDAAQDVATLRAQADRARADLASLEAQRKTEIDALEQRRKTDERAVGVLATTPVTTPPTAPSPGSTAETARPARPRSAKDFLRVARQQIRDGNEREAEATLEMAEVRALNEADGHPGTSPEAMVIRNARIAVQSGRADDALRIIDSASPR